MFRYFVLFAFCFTAVAGTVQASSLSLECQEAIRSGESIRNPDIYTACGFDDRQMALGEWAIWAQKESAGQALYEICVRHPDSSSSESFCQKAVSLGNGPALLRQANRLYEQKKYPEAAAFYRKALSSSLLNEIEKGDIGQKMGLLYMDPDSSYYNPQKGLPLIERAINRRGATANNLMGVYALFGMQNVPQNPEKSFEYFWRAILLGCPSAEENLGLWHLAHQKKIDTQTVRDEMAKRMFSCTPPAYVPPAERPKHSCNCMEVNERERSAALYPYRLIAVSDDKKSATLLDEKKQRVDIQPGTELPNGMKISEIGKKGVILTGSKRVVLNLAPVDDCPQICQQQKSFLDIQSKTIKPYHLSFTPKECSDILYYAERLVDTNLPFTGKTECNFSADMDKTTDLLMNL